VVYGPGPGPASKPTPEYGSWWSPPGENNNVVHLQPTDENGHLIVPHNQPLPPVIVENPFKNYEPPQGKWSSDVQTPSSFKNYFTNAPSIALKNRAKQQPKSKSPAWPTPSKYDTQMF